MTIEELKLEFRQFARDAKLTAEYAAAVEDGLVLGSAVYGDKTMTAPIHKIFDAAGEEARDFGAYLFMIARRRPDLAEWCHTYMRKAAELHKITRQLGR